MSNRFHGQRTGFNGDRKHVRKKRRNPVNKIPVRKAIASLCQNKSHIPEHLWGYIQCLIDQNNNIKKGQDYDGLIHKLSGLVGYDPKHGFIRMDDESYSRLLNEICDFVRHYHESKATCAS